MTNRFIIQIIDHNDGSRSKDFVCTYDELKASLIESADAIDQEDYILLVAILPEDETETPQISTTPLVSIQTLLESWDWEKSAEKAEKLEMEYEDDDHPY